MALDNLVNRFRRIGNSITAGVYVLHLELMKDSRFDDMGVFHPNPEKREEFIQKNRFEQLTLLGFPPLSQQPTNIFEAFNSYLDNIIEENPLPDYIYYQILGIKKRIGERSISEAEVRDILTGNKMIGELPSDYTCDGQPYYGLYLDSLTRTICLDSKS